MSCRSIFTPITSMLLKCNCLNSYVKILTHDDRTGQCTNQLKKTLKVCELFRVSVMYYFAYIY